MKITCDGPSEEAFISIEGVKNIQRFMKLRNPKIADVNLERLIDESLLRELDKSGFIEQRSGERPFDNERYFY